MATLTACHREWASRPDDERFTSLTGMRDHFVAERSRSRSVVASCRQIELRPVANGNPMQDLEVVGQAGVPYAMTNWAFGQLCQLAAGPADKAPPSAYIASLPAPLAADCLNYGLKYKREIEDVGLLLTTPDRSQLPAIPAPGIVPAGPIPGALRAATGPRYGRVWQAEVLETLCKRFGDGLSGDWKIPGEFGKAVAVTKANTTLYGSDRDMFIFLADEERRVELPNRRPGQRGSLARGFFLGNSEVGKSTLMLSTFYFDYVCCNRFVWGAEGLQEIKLRHTASAPDRWLEEIEPALLSYSQSSMAGIETAVANARAKRLDDVDAFLRDRFGARMIAGLQAVHQLEEQRPIETLWDAATAVTAYAKSVPHQDKRIDLETQAGKLLDLVAA